MKHTKLKANQLLVAMGALIVISIAVDGMIIGPKTGSLKRKIAERTELRNRLDVLAVEQGKVVEATHSLGVEDLEVLLSAPQEEAVAYLGRTLAASGLTRLDLTTVKTEQDMNLTRTIFSVRAMGRYQQLVEFTRMLESDVRLASIDDFTITPSLTSKSLEGRFMLSIYDTKDKR